MHLLSVIAFFAIKWTAKSSSSHIRAMFSAGLSDTQPHKWQKYLDSASEDSFNRFIEENYGSSCKNKVEMNENR